MKILVTGGAGFIGSAVVRHIIENTKDEVRVMDCLTYAGNLESLATVADSERYSFTQTDITDAKSISEQFSDFRPDIVMHLAAESHVDRWKQPVTTGQPWMRPRSRPSASIISLLMKFMVTCTALMTCLRKKRLMRQAARTLPLRPGVTIWCVPGTVPTVCR